jgi:predicted component of type VI protein secretion system
MSDTNTDPVQPAPNAGSFLESLVRSNRAIKAGRAESMADSTRIVYRRRVEDLVAKIKKLKRTLIDALDLSGDSALSLKLAQNYDENEWVQNDITTRLEIRNATIQLVAAYQGYSELFGPSIQLLDGLDITHVNVLD